MTQHPIHLRSPQADGANQAPTEARLVSPVTSAMARITHAQDDLEAMISRVYERLSPVLSIERPEPKDQAKDDPEVHISTHHGDLVTILGRLREQEERLGKLIDRLTI
jgi:hypothetical protein